MPAVPVVMPADKEPVLQTYEVPPVAVKMAVPPGHKIPSLAVAPEVSATVIEGVGAGFTTMDCVAEPEHPLASVTEYLIVTVPVPVGINAPPAMAPGPLIIPKLPPAGVADNGRVAFKHNAALLLVIAGAGGVQTPGTVETEVEAGLATLLSLSHKQRVSMLSAVWV